MARHLNPRFTALGYPNRARALALAADHQRAFAGMLRHMRARGGQQRGGRGRDVTGRR